SGVPVLLECGSVGGPLVRRHLQRGPKARAVTLDRLARRLVRGPVQPEVCVLQALVKTRGNPKLEVWIERVVGHVVGGARPDLGVCSIDLITQRVTLLLGSPHRYHEEAHGGAKTLDRVLVEPPTVDSALG